MPAIRTRGVYRPQGDTELLAAVLRQGSLFPPGANVLDLCTGTGVLAITAAQRGASRVTAVDISRRAVLAARVNAWLARAPVRALAGDLFGPVDDEVFDLIVANPPYVPGRRPVRHGRERSWEGGPYGRSILDPICAQAGTRLTPGGSLLMVHSALCGESETLQALGRAQLDTTILARRRQPFGPVLRSRAAMLEDLGLIRPGEREEELVVFRARR